MNMYMNKKMYIYIYVLVPTKAFSDPLHDRLTVLNFLLRALEP